MKTGTTAPAPHHWHHQSVRALTGAGITLPPHGADITIDSSASGAGAVQVARVLVGNASTYAACTILEPQVPISWAKVLSPFTFWKGNLTTGSTGYVYVMTEAGVVETPDQPSFLIA